MNVVNCLIIPLLHHILLNGKTSATKQTGYRCRADMMHLLQLMEISRGSTIIIIQQCFIDKDLSEIIDNWTLQHGLITLSFHLSNFDDVMPEIVDDVISKKKLSTYRAMLNFVVFCDDCLPKMNEMISMTDYECGKRSLLRHFSKWLFIYMEVSTQEIASIDSVLDNVALAYKLVNTCCDADHVTVQTLMWKPGGRYWSYIGSISPSSHKPDNSGPLFPNTQYGLNRRHLNVGAMEWTNFCKKSNASDNASVSFIHVCRDVLDYLSDSLNYSTRYFRRGTLSLRLLFLHYTMLVIVELNMYFSYSFIEPPDQIWGEKLPNDSWNGLLGMIVREEIDFSAIPFGKTVERTEVLSFSAMVWNSPYQVSYKKQYSDWISLVACFKWEVYACGFIAFLWYIGLSIILEMTAKSEKGEKTSLCNRDLSGIVIAGVSAPLHQGTQYVPGALSGRVLYVSYWIFCIIITAVYTGNLIAFLTVSKENIPFDSLEELADNDEYELVVQRGSYIENQLRFSNVSVMQSLWRKVVSSRNSKYKNSLDEYDYHKRLLQSGKYALIELSVTLDEIDLTIRELKRMPRDVMFLPLSFPFPLDSPLTELFSEKIMFLYDSGMLDGLERKWSYNRRVTEDEHTSASQLVITDLQSAYTACAAGVFVAGISLTVEYLWNHAKLQNGVDANTP